MHRGVDVDLDREWRTELGRGRQGLAAAAMVVVGAVLCVVARPSTWTGADVANRQAGFALGVLLVLAGLGVLLYDGRQAVVVDPVAREVRVENRSRFRSSVRAFPFDEIERTSVSTLAGRTGGTPAHVVILHLRSGEQVAVFAGVYPGAFSRSAVEERARRIDAYRTAP
ncbi:MAG: hypothetical protein U0Q07_17035 [Acidimicrobiales bacterium]